MIFTYDPESDCLYVRVTDRLVVTTRDLGNGVLVDLDEDAGVIGVEFLMVNDLGQTWRRVA